MFPNHVRIGGIYYTCFKGGRKGEFDSPHYSIVIARGYDPNVFTIVPLSSSSNDPRSSIDLGVISELDWDGKGTHSYAVFTHSKAVRYDRLNPIQNKKDPSTRIFPILKQEQLMPIIQKAISYLTKNLSYELREQIFQSLLIETRLLIQNENSKQTDQTT